MTQEDINHHGIWMQKENFVYSFDEGLAKELFSFFQKEKTKSVVDLGCGTGDYIQYFLKNGLINCEGYDGNPYTHEITKGLGQVLDLAELQNLGRKFDWVLSLEVGEHIPEKYQDIFIDNLVSHCKKGVIVSWAIPGQGGQGHFNEKSNKEIEKCFKKRGFWLDIPTSETFRKEADIFYFSKTIMVFRKKKDWRSLFFSSEK